MISYENIYKYSSPGNGTPGSILGDVHRFRRVEREGFNATDIVDTRFFKLLFYFFNDEPDPNRVDWFNGGPSGLLSPTWLDNPTGDYYKYNSAWAYLKSNYEEERADALVQFVNLLSQISSESPWYFQSISGIDEALAREKWQINEERKKISIEGMNDPVDHRIESLLSLYRSIVWSHARKCEVLPSNLRKFDMGMFVFSGLFRGLIVKNDKEGNQSGWAQIGRFNEDIDRVNYKYIEFHNCEISMDSIKSGFGEISNETGFEQGFTIDIYFDDCYEYEYNPFVMRSFGDFFVWDAWMTSRNEDGNAVGNIGNVFYNDEELESIENDTSLDINERLDYFNYVENNANKPYKRLELDGLGNIGDDHILPATSEPTGMGNIKDSHILPTTSEPAPSLLDKIGDMASRVAMQAVEQAKGAVNSIKNAAVNEVTGGLGNIYGLGGGVMGTADAIQQEVSKQVQSLKNKITGNITGTLDNISKSATRASITPITDTIKKTGNNIADSVDTVNDKVVGGFNDSTGVYTRGESEDLGNIYYGNQIGKNRLNTM